MPLDNPVVQEGWQAPALLNNWINFGAPFNPAGFWLDSVGVVHLRGALQGGSTGSTFFVLPLGYRPVNREALQAMWNSSTLGWGLGKVDILSTGEALCNVGAPSGVMFAFLLDGLTFRAA